MRARGRRAGRGLGGGAGGRAERGVGARGRGVQEAAGQAGAARSGSGRRRGGGRGGGGGGRGRVGVGWGWRRSRGEGGEPGKEGAPGPLRRPARPGVSCSPSATPVSKSARSEKGRGGQRLTPPSAARGTGRCAASPPHPGNPLPRRPATEAASRLHPGTRALLSHPPPASRVPLCPSFAGGRTIPREEGERFGPSGRQQPQVMGRCLGPPRWHPVSMGGR